ncbi:MAG: hypothetical protein SGILL_005051 [Bacillariaceae sp.]
MNTSRDAAEHYDYGFDDSSIESTEESMDEEIHAISIKTEKDQKPSDITAYKETTSYKRWFDAHVAENSRNASAKSKVGLLCGINLTIYFRETEDPSKVSPRRRNTIAPVNKIATMLTFDPNSGLYNHLIRGKAYIVVDDGRARLSKHTLWQLQELIAESKIKYHKYGADFSREGQIELLKACVQFKKGKFIPKSVYGMALANTEDPAWEDKYIPRSSSKQALLAMQQQQENPDLAVDEASGPMKRSSASHWFISSIVKLDDDLQQEQE